MRERRFRWNLFNRLYISYISFLLLPVLGFSFLFQLVIVDYMKSEINSNDIDSLSLLAENSEHVLKRAWSNAVSLTMDPRLGSLMTLQSRSGDDPREDSEYVSAILDMLTLMKSMNNVDELIHSFYIYNEQTGILLSSKGEVLPAEEHFDTAWLSYYEPDMNGLKYISSRRPVDQAYLESGEHYIDVDRDIHSDVITMLFPLAYHPYQSLEGAVVINLIERNLIYSPEGEMGYFLFDREGRLLSAPSGRDDKELENLALQALGRAEDRGSFDAEQEGRRFLVSYLQARGNGLLFLKLTPLSEFYGMIRRLQLIFAAMTASVLMLGLILAFRFTRGIYDPIRSALTGLNRLSDSGRDRKNSDELKQINLAVDRILKKNREVSALVERNRLSLKESALLDLIGGNADAGERVFSDRQGPFVCFILTLSGYREFAEHYSQGEQFTIRSLLLHQAEELLALSSEGGGVLLSSDKIALAARAGDEREADELALRILEGLKDNLPVVISRGGLYRGWDSLRRSFLEAREGLDYRISFPASRRLLRSPFNSGGGRRPDLESRVQSLLNSLKKGESDALSSLVSGLLEDLLGEQILTLDQLLDQLSFLISGTNRILRGAGISDSRLLERHRSLYDLIGDQENRDELQDSLRAYYLRAAELIREQESSMSSARVLLRIMQERFRDPNLDLTSLSEEAGLSYSHTRKLIKDETGLSFVDYLNGLRIEASRDPLREGKKTIREIAVEVGYHNGQSFSRFFKKFEGISPGEFRRRRISGGSPSPD